MHGPDGSARGSAGGFAPDAAPHASTDVAPSTSPDAARLAVRIADLAVSFERRHADPVVALDGLDLTVAAGEVVALIGPNGCGKSTLLRVIDGLLRPDRGTVEVSGRAVVGPDPAVGFVFQEPRLLAWRDILDNVAFPLEIAGVGPDERRARAREMLRVVGLEGAATDRPHQLSGGMRQRASIARALTLGPSILLLDEPFSALDALTRERFNIELAKLWERRVTTIILVTHDVREALFVADRVVVLSPRPGRVLATVTSPLGRPRRAADLDDPRLGAAAIQVRRHLGYSGEEGDRPSELTAAAGLGTTIGGAP